MITDANGKPMNDEDEAPKNGHNKSSDTMDIRTVPTGTLIYNLVLVAGREQGCAAMLSQLEAMKAQQKVVGDPPQIGALRAEHVVLEKHRYVMAAELNSRYADIDAKRCADLGIEIYEPGELSEKPPGEEN